MNYGEYLDREEIICRNCGKYSGFAYTSSPSGALHSLPEDWWWDFYDGPHVFCYDCTDWEGENHVISWPKDKDGKGYSLYEGDWVV